MMDSYVIYDGLSLLGLSVKSEFLDIRPEFDDPNRLTSPGGVIEYAQCVMSSSWVSLYMVEVIDASIFDFNRGIVDSEGKVFRAQSGIHLRRETVDQINVKLNDRGGDKYALRTH